ncbi:hypothetical protein KY311_04330 [Candidatus Woesearchaeota archaeon]|nr:hypothetical protein [Candidatus Woesearchaeota archaeon]
MVAKISSKKTRRFGHHTAVLAATYEEIVGEPYDPNASTRAIRKSTARLNQSGLQALFKDEVETGLVTVLDDEVIVKDEELKAEGQMLLDFDTLEPDHVNDVHEHYAALDIDGDPVQRQQQSYFGMLGSFVKYRVLRMWLYRKN